MVRACIIAALLASSACVADNQPAPAVDLDLPGHFPPPRPLVDNPLTADKIELGRHLFYDTRLSVNETISCSSCHQQRVAFADDRSVSPGATGELGALNAPSLGNVIYGHPLTWSHSRILAIEDQLLGPMFGDAPLEMGMRGAEDDILARLRDEPVYHDLFSRAFPELAAEPIDLDRARLALASFVRSLVSYSSPFDAFLQGDSTALSPSARRGSELFYSSRLGCGGCHTGFNFSSAVVSSTSTGQQLDPFHNIGLYNIDGAGGYPAVAPGLIAESGVDRDMGRFRVPSLRNVALTAPYMHDGSVATLQEVLAIYEAGGRNVESGPNAGDGRLNPFRSQLLPQFELTDSERADVLAFLRSLSDERFTTTPAFANPW